MTSDNRLKSTRVRPGFWFVPRRFGFGATPATWQGWALTVGALAAVVLLVQSIEPKGVGAVCAIGVVLGMTLVSWQKTDGAWRWRWGDRR